MKLLPTFALAIWATVVSVEAVPLRLLVVTNNQEIADSIRLGHAVPNANMDSGILRYGIAAGPDAHHGYRPCFIRKVHNKAIQISNVFRTALGLPPIELPGLDGGGHPTFGILPVKGPNNEVTTRGGDVARIVTDYSHHHHGHHGHHHHGHHGDLTFSRLHHKHHHHHGFCRKSPFFKRLSFALMSLGPWEGRIVAFVLGCGLGVILRMFWVLSLITFRAIRGRRTEQIVSEYHVIHEYEDLSAPPTYAYVDEKADAKKDSDAAQAQA